MVGFLLLIVVIGLVVGAYYLAPRFERSSPQIRLPESDALGLAPIEIVVGDEGAGLKSVTATLSAGGSDNTLVSEQYAEPVSEKKFTVALSKVAGLKEGPAMLRVIARDASLWNFFSGNETVVEKNLTIDITPPTRRAHRRRPLRQFRRRRRDRLQGVGRHGDERREDRRLLLPGLQRPDQGPAGPLLRALRASLQRAAGREGHARRHRQGGQHARDARSPTS